ncbi:MAG: transglycosylase SLT domain-containing protein [Deltaproteobacteria bacterium]|nr:transglycosylase SLT domain-containing protein [Deltaproteobacteria bacterium]
MAWLHNIPPMISALAFGYGVGMAAPDSTLDGMRMALDPGVSASRHHPGGVGQRPMDVGMPQHAWAGRGAVAGAPRAGYPPQGRYGAQYPAPGYRAAGPGDPRGHGGDNESRHLARLRERGMADGHSCRMHHPTHSVPPSYASTEDGAYEEDVDDLDAAAHQALSRLQLPDFKVPITRRALKYVRFLTRTHRGRGLFESWLKRSGRYQDLVQQTLREWHLPEDLIWVAMIESGFDPRAKSPAGAMGMWQFMKATGGVYGLEVTPFKDDRRNPVKATEAAAHHLRDLHQRFGSWELAFAAYNMGYEQLLDRIDRYGTTDFSELARQRALPSETAAYVPKIVAAALVANNLDRYGFGDVKVFKPIHHAEVVVPGGTKLSLLAKAAGVSTSTIRKYNPHFRKDYVPPHGESIVLIPAQSLSRTRAALPAMMDNRVASTDADILVPDDLFGLSGGGKAERGRHADWNEGENLLRMLPKPKRRSLRSMLGAKRPAPTDDAVAGLAEEFGHRRTDRETVMYRVGPGDTLIGVAKQFAIDIDDLAQDNSLDPDAKLREGALLKLSVKRGVLDRWKRKAGAAATSKKSARKPKKRAEG